MLHSKELIALISYKVLWEPDLAHVIEVTVSTSGGVKNIFATGGEFSKPLRQQPVLSVTFSLLLPDTDTYNRLVDSSVFSFPISVSLVNKKEEKVVESFVGYIDSCSISSRVGEYVIANVSMVVSTVE